MSWPNAPMLIDDTNYVLAASVGGSECIRSETGTLVDAEIWWYQVGDVSGKGGEVWCGDQSNGYTKLGDWVDPNDPADQDFYLMVSDMTLTVGTNIATVTAGADDAWLKIGGAGSANCVVTEGDEGLHGSTFTVSLGVDGIVALSVKTGWYIEMDNQPT